MSSARREVREKTDEKVHEINRKIRDLERIRAKLVELADACETHGTAEDCLVLHALEGPDHGAESEGGSG